MHRAILILCLCASATPSRILGIFPHTGKSHFDVFESLMLALANRGHDVTVMSFYPQTTKVANYTDISLVGTIPLFLNALTFDSIADNSGFNFNNMPFISSLGLACCEPILSSGVVRDLLRSDKEFDLLIFEIFNTDCFLGFAHRFKAPYIGFSSTGLMVPHNGRLGNPQNPSYIPNLDFPFSDKMTFPERMLNAGSVLYFRLSRLYYYDAQGEKIARKYFGEDMPSLEDIASNIQLMFTNTHYSLNLPRPLVPAIVPVGGLCIKPSKPLPQNVEQYISEAKDGVILFSMGSLLLANSFPDEKRNAFMNAFAELPQKFIMKWENTTFPNQPSNLKTMQWLPQRDILAHPKVLAFITHGGLLGLSEAVYSGVPVIGIPIFGDQPSNIAAVVANGVGIKLSYSTLTKETILEALKKIIHDKSYKNNALKLASVYRDRPQEPLDTAVYWTEFVLRHNGTPFMQSAAVHQPWYENLLLDVIAALAILLVVIFKVLLFIARRITVYLSNILYNNNKVKKNV